MKKIGVLTSGGDAPGMNAAIRAVVKTAIANGIQPIGFIKGHNGILEKKYRVMDRESVSGIIHSGGTILKTARCMEFYEASYREKAFHNAKEIGLDGLVVIGGVIVSEGYGNPVEIATQIQEKTGIDSRATILGHVQRGGNPTLKDRVNATRMGYYAVKLLEEGKTNRVVALQQGNLVDYDIQEALKMKKPLDMDLYNMMMEISF